MKDDLTCISCGYSWSSSWDPARRCRSCGSRNVSNLIHVEDDLKRQGFHVRCDETNNGPEDVEAGRLNIDVVLPGVKE